MLNKVIIFKVLVPAMDTTKEYTHASFSSAFASVSRKKQSASTSESSDKPPPRRLGSRYGNLSPKRNRVTSYFSTHGRQPQRFAHVDQVLLLTNPAQHNTSILTVDGHY